ncbi:hypothetical protein [Micromonospora chalcea]|uniref:hypothetical protein n=1 Tax=Micromonospora chalcea TaxID=1874 RepID=UPI00157DC490|nr:hypothetical protein [Micromonospora chalcea]
MITDERVRYVPELGVWTVDMTGVTAALPGQAEHILGAAMFHAREADAGLEGCTCDPGDQHWDGPRLRVPTPPYGHGVAQAQGSNSRLLVIGHGGRIQVAAMTGQEHQGNPCPLRNVDGEERAKELVERGGTGLTELWGLSVAFPAGAGPLQPLPAHATPEVWESEPVRFSASGLTMNVPGRHVHPGVQSSLAAYRDLALQVTELNRAAREAQDRAENAPRELRREVAQAAASGRRADAAKAAQRIRDLEVEAQAAKAVADGTEDALDTARAAVVKGMTEHRAEWLAYLSGQGGAALGRLDAALTELGQALADVVAVDAMRANVERPLAPGGQVFAQASALSPDVSATLAAAQEVREKAAKTLAPLSRYGQGEKATKRRVKAAA